VYHYFIELCFDGLSVYFLFIFKHNGTCELKKICIDFTE
jgi:hypothetical protein